jgi:hypothetical protein
MDSEKPISNTQNWHNSVRTCRVHTCNSSWPKYGLYTIRLDPDSFKTTIFMWGKYSYLWLPMGIAYSPDTFQAKMSELMVALEFIWAYIDNLLCITKGNLDDHIMKLKQVLIRLQCERLKMNAKNCSFCATETEYWDVFEPVATSSFKP